MLTRDGWLLAVIVAAMILLGRLLGVLELFVLGAAVGVLLIVVVVRTALVRLDVAVRRDVHPPRVHAGAPSRIELEVSNHGVRTTPVLRVTDAVSGTRGADLAIAPIQPGGRARAAYRLPTERRGIVAIGPLDLLVGDPFGLTVLRVRGAGRTELTVYPRIDQIAGLPETMGHDPEAAEESPSSLGQVGEEFFALRPYQIGDELRRVHWPSTARFDELQVRQTELPWQGRATVLLDLRAGAQTTESLDIGVSAAASILTAVRHTGDLFRLVSTDGTDSGFVPGNAAYGAVLEYLATVPVSSATGLGRILDSLSRTSHGGALVVISGLLDSHDRLRLDALRPRFTTVTIVDVDRSAWDPSAPEPDPGAGPGRQRDITVTRSQPFAAGWNRAMSSRHRSGGHRPARSVR
ncbi:MAG: DUF58 domain-containing protein [Acidimicrobiales bacterium]